MSRHKLVKALDLDEELDDFQGADESDYEEEVGANDRGTDCSLSVITKVRAEGLIRIP